MSPEADAHALSRLTPEFQLLLVWLLGSAAAIVVALAPLSAAFTNGHYVPIGPDSFYHARRILDAAADPAAFYQFDPLMHVPEGSLVIWPWAYDYVMSLVVRGAFALHLSRDPMSIIVHIPVYLFPVAIALMIVICRALSLGTLATLIAVLCTAFFPLNQSLYGIGYIDHHFAEHLFVLASLGSGLMWWRQPHSRAWPVVTGLVLASAPGVHTGLFILQLPLLATFGWTWLRGLPRPAHTLPFALALALGTLAIALPSVALQEGRFEFFTLSWFQVYVAACTAALCLFFSRTSFSPRFLGVLVTVIVAMLAIMASQMPLMRDFLSVSVEGMDSISEVQSVFQLLVRSQSVTYVASLYTLLVFLAPAVPLLAAWQVFREREPQLILFWFSCLFGAALLLMQLRLQYFGSYALYLPWLLLASRRVRQGAVKPAVAWSVLAVVAVVSYSPAVMNRLFEKHVVAGDPYYDIAGAMFAALARECRQNPGTVLARPFDGHYIRFHSNCSVIANNFVVTSQHEEKIREENALLRVAAADLAERAPFVRYVYARRASIFYSGPDGLIRVNPKGDATQPDPPLMDELLKLDPRHLPPGFRMVYELRFEDEARTPFARLFAIGEP